MVLIFLENALNIVIFTHAPNLSQNSFSSSCHHPTRQREITHSLQAEFFKNLFLASVERVVENYELL